MAIRTFELRVLALQLISGQVVLEIVLTIGSVNQLIIPALVFDMALLAFLLIIIGMQAFVGFNSLLKHGMTGQAILSADLFFELVTFGAILQSFKSSMGLV
ncbi:hypothetical protein JW960_10120 [candidate division KSB1 bacterium]|nr:hypothetical protein [candidate division KSB1 bacterium]